MNKGKVTQIISAIVDVKFPGGVQLPNILNALQCENNG